MCVEEISKLVKRAYDEGFEDGKKEATTITFPGYGEITTPLKDIQITPSITPSTPWNPSITSPNDWPPSIIYCGRSYTCNLQDDNAGKIANVEA